jgi:biotin synthase
MKFSTVLEHVVSSHHATHEDIITLLRANKEETVMLRDAADSVRQRFLGDAVHLRAIIEFSNFCRCQCAYCGLNALNDNTERYRMSKNEIYAAAKTATEAGYKTLVLQSGEDLFFTKELVADIIAMLQEHWPDIAITLSLGERPRDHYQAWYEAGASRYLLKHETANPVLYQYFHAGDLLTTRIEHTLTLIKIGYQTGGGFLIGLPGQTLRDIADDLLLAQALNIKMISAGTFIANPKTELGREANGSVSLTLKAMSIARLLAPTALIPATSALLSLLGPEEQAAALQYGANVLMQKAENIELQKLYALYPKTYDARPLHERRNAAEMLVSQAGRFTGQGQGNYNEVE